MSPTELMQMIVVGLAAVGSITAAGWRVASWLVMRLEKMIREQQQELLHAHEEAKVRLIAIEGKLDLMNGTQRRHETRLAHIEGWRDAQEARP